MIRAQSNALIRLTGGVTIRAEGAGGSFSMIAYTGGKLSLPNFEHPIVVDLQGMTGTDRSRPILRQHDPRNIVGHTSKITNDGRTVVARGVISGTGPAAREVRSSGQNGFPWQASIGVMPQALEFVGAGRTANVNGQELAGPMLIARRSILREISFVPLGADDNTSARIAAKAATGACMTFEQWLEAKGFVLASISDQQKLFLKSTYDAEIAAAATVGDTGGGEPENDENADDGEADPADTIAASGADDQIKADRKRLAAESKRVGRLRSIEATYTGQLKPADLTAITASAIEDGWSANRYELELIRKRRPDASTIPAGGGRNPTPQADAQVIEAALCMTVGMSEKFIGDRIPVASREQVMNSATSGRYRGFGIHALMDTVINAAGKNFVGSRKSHDFIRAAFESDRMIAASGFSTVSLSGVLSSVANKALIDAYAAVEVTWPFFCAVRNHSDFKAHTRYRMDINGAFKKVAPDGEIKHVTLSDATYTNTLATYGAMVALNRQMIINDDLGAFLQLPALLGNRSALRIEEAAYVLLLSNPSSFFASGNGNTLTGASSALSIASIASAEKLFANFVSDGKPVLNSPSFVLTGTTLKSDAQNIFDEKVIIASSLGSTSSRVVEPAKNKMFNKYRPYGSPYVDNTAVKDQDGAAITGQSSTRWYLFGNPAVRAAIAIAFLNGQRNPTIESAETDFNTLGMQWRAFHDFGVGMEEVTGAVMSDGA